MDVAGVILGSLALILTLLSATVAGFQLRHHVRFRRPVFAVRQAELEAKMKREFAIVGPGSIVLNIRGAAHPVTINKWEAVLFDGDRPRGGFSTEMARPITLEPEVWTLVPIRFEVGMGLNTDPPSSLVVEVYLTNPRDVFIVPVRLKLAKDGSRYYHDDLDQHVDELHRTLWRRRGWFPTRISAVLSKLRSRR